MLQSIAPDPLGDKSIPGIEAAPSELLVVFGLLIEPEQHLRKHVGIGWASRLVIARFGSS